MMHRDVINQDFTIRGPNIRNIILLFITDLKISPNGLASAIRLHSSHFSFVDEKQLSNETVPFSHSAIVVL
jgi:hypothetical protein